MRMSPQKNGVVASMMFPMFDPQGSWGTRDPKIMHPMLRVHTRGAHQENMTATKREKKCHQFFFKWVACRRNHLGMLIHFWGYDMSIIIRSCTPSFLGMIPQKLLTNLEESPWNLSENLWRETCSSASLCAKQLRSCKHRDSTYKTGSKVQYKGDPKHLEVISFFINQMPNNFNSLQEL